MTQPTAEPVMETRNQFQDQKDRTWTIHLTTRKVAELQRRTGYLITSILERREGTQEFADNWPLMLDTLEVLLADQLQQRQITPDDLLDSIGWESMEPVLKAVQWALVFFSPPQTRDHWEKVLTLVWEEIDRQNQDRMKQARQEIDSGQVSSALRESVELNLGNTPSGN